MSCCWWRWHVTILVHRFFYSFQPPCCGSSVTNNEVEPIRRCPQTCTDRIALTTIAWTGGPSSPFTFFFPYTLTRIPTQASILCTLTWVHDVQDIAIRISRGAPTRSHGYGSLRTGEPELNLVYDNQQAVSCFGSIGSIGSLRTVSISRIVPEATGRPAELSVSTRAAVPSPPPK